MEHPIFSPQVVKSGSNTESHQHPYGKIPWSALTDEQKSQLLLGCTRMLRSELFVKEYKSWETPDVAYCEP